MEAKKIVKFLKENFNIGSKYDIAFIMGSGLSGGVPDFSDEIIVDYEQTPMPKSKVEGFKGQFIFGKLNGKNVVKLTRYHYYETGERSLVNLPFEILSLLGVETVVMATSTGAVNKKLKAGDLLLIKDHINLAGNNPLINSEKIEFIDLSNAYDKSLRDSVLSIAKKNKIKLKEGIHMQVSGPSYETKAEVYMARKLGADTISMSTAFDTICARKHNIKVLSFAFVSNASGETDLKHEDVLKNAQQNSKKIKTLLNNLFS